MALSPLQNGEVWGLTWSRAASMRGAGEGRCMAASLSPSPRPGYSQPPCCAPGIWEGSTVVMVISRTSKSSPLFPTDSPKFCLHP